MDILNNIVQYILGFGAAVFVPLIMLIVGLICKMKFSDAFVAALTLGIGLAAPTGISLPGTDVGWPALSAIAWAWPLGILCFPLLIVINLVMLAFKWTNVLNVDLWNAWTKLCTCVITYFLCISAGMSEPVAVALGFLAAAIQIVLELKIGDAIQPTIEKITGIPGVTVPHALMLSCTRP